MKQTPDSTCVRPCIVLTLAIAGMGLRVYAGNAEIHDASVWPARRALGGDIAVNRSERSQGTQPPGELSQHEPGGVLTLRRALELALMNSPELASVEYGVRAAESDAGQAGAMPNPELEIEAEDFGGSGTKKGYDSVQTTVRLSQTIELAGKRSKRRDSALSEARLAGWAYEAKRLDVLTQTKKSFIDVLAAQGRLAMAESAVILAEDVRRDAAERVKAGKVSRLEETKAGVEASSARISKDKAYRDLEIARRFLAAAWGSTTPLFAEVEGDWSGVKEAPSLADLASALDQAPEVAAWEDRVRSGQQALDQARADRVPDITVSAGISRTEEDGDLAGLVGLSLPIPLFNRNADGILAARHQFARVEYARQAARLQAATELAVAHGRLETAKAEVTAINSELLPSSQQVFNAAQAGYREGKCGYLDVLDAQRTLGQSKTRHLEALADYHKAAADVERLTGMPLDTIR